MNTSRLGCLTPSGLIAAGLTIVIIVGLSLLQGGVVFSPGALNAQPGEPLGNFTSHAEFSGQCRLCHAPFWDAAGMAARCEACHIEIPAQLADPATLHGALIQSNPSLACRDCHPEHRGANAALTDFHGNGFPHEVLGYSLAGHAHTSGGLPFLCSDCHGSDVTTFDRAICQSCHNQIDANFTTTHILAFGSDCLACHDGIDTYGSLFDHNRFLFQLAGKHVGTPCASCHLNARTIPDLQSAPTDCFACHAKDDTHEGSLGTDCASCHTPAGWTPTTFDHNVFAFKLGGKHVDLLCETCHIGKLIENTPTDCNSCHSSDDVHQGNLGIDCENCHTPAGWTPSVFDHNLAAFKLLGKHATAACETCHTDNLFKNTPTDCHSCHVADDTHLGRYGTNCETCHSPAGWTPATFDHNLAGFRLTGKHVNVACESCHSDGVFLGTPTNCYSCHSGDDAHQGRFRTSCGTCHSPSGWTPATFDHNLAAFRLTGQHATAACASCHINGIYQGTSTDCTSCHSGDDAHQGRFGTTCGTCHSPAGWTPATFDHNLASFRLTGQHATAACASCHINGVFLGTPTDCTSCHSGDDAHQGRFGTSCGTCHTPTGWTPATFDHNLAAFKLTGRHATVACASCHINGVYLGTPTDCYSCHSGDDAHQGRFGTSCGTCHTPTGWTPATFDHNLAAFRLTGQHATVACASCHINGVYQGTPTDCYSCHSGDDAHQGRFGTSCGSCHSTSGWTPASFDHNLTNFPLTGAHAGLACSQCHSGGVYSGLSTACSSCHSEPAYHAGLFGGMACNECHNTSSWTPASYDLSHPSSCDGPCINHEGASCRDCHTTNLNTATCTKCHDSNNPGD